LLQQPSDILPILGKILLELGCPLYGVGDLLTKLVSITFVDEQKRSRK
jgi:hypothetical protein